MYDRQLACRTTGNNENLNRLAACCTFSKESLK